MRICQWSILIVATLSILIVGCADVSLLMTAARMKSPYPPSLSEDNGLDTEKGANKLTDIKMLLEMTRAQSIFQQTGSSAFHQVVSDIRQQKPDIPDRYLPVIEEEVRRVVLQAMVQEGGLLDKMSPLYAKYFTHDEVREILAFYQSDAGKKIVDVSSELMPEAGQVTSRWQAALNPVIQQRVIERLRAEGVQLK